MTAVFHARKTAFLQLTLSYRPHAARVSMLQPFCRLVSFGSFLDGLKLAGFTEIGVPCLCCWRKDVCEVEAAWFEACSTNFAGFADSLFFAIRSSLSANIIQVLEEKTMHLCVYLRISVCTSVVYASVRASVSLCVCVCLYVGTCANVSFCGSLHV